MIKLCPDRTEKDTTYMIKYIIQSKRYILYENKIYLCINLTS
jgi:hypothetical protein